MNAIHGIIGLSTSIANLYLSYHRHLVNGLPFPRLPHATKSAEARAVGLAVRRSSMMRLVNISQTLSGSLSCARGS